MGKLIVAKGFEKFPKVKQTTQYGHTAHQQCDVKRSRPKILQIISWLIK